MTIRLQARKLRAPSRSGAIAQLGERYTGSVEVGGSIPPSSTIVSRGSLGEQSTSRLELKAFDLRSSLCEQNRDSQTTGESEGNRRPHRLEA